MTSIKEIDPHWDSNSEVDEADADAPRVAQWVDEDDLHSDSGSSKLPAMVSAISAACHQF